MGHTYFHEWEQSHTRCPSDLNRMPEPPRGFCWELVSVIEVQEPVVDDEGNLYMRKFLRAFWKRPVAASSDH